MTAREKALTKRRCLRFLKLWRGHLGLNRWNFAVKFEDGPLVVNGEWRGDVAAAINSNWQYMNAQVQFSNDLCFSMPDFELEQVVIHELVHTFFSPFETQPDMEELMVTQIARSFQMLVSK